MRANGIVRHVLRGVEGKIHRARLNAVCAAAVALLRGGQVGLAALGRAISPNSYKHGIKRIDRLLGNHALVHEVEVFYAELARYVLRTIRRPVIILDWTEAGKGACALTAAVPLHGRAITIYSVVAPLSKYASATVEREFMEVLREFLPPDSKPILVGDAGFRAPWMKRVRAMGWDFVARVRGRTLVQCVGASGWQHLTAFHSRATRTPRALGSYLVVRNQRVEAQLVVVDKRSRRRARTTLVRRNARAARAAKAAREPWLLATSLTLPATEVVQLYAARMQIELTFRDLKSHRFGWGFENARCRSTTRIAVQMMLAAVASLVALLVGLAADQDGIARRYQANTTRNRRVISLVTLGRAILSTCSAHIPIASLRDHMPFEGIP